MQVKDHGECGRNVTWKLENGVLTISGKGRMREYKALESPFHVRQDIQKVVIEEGVTSISGNLFQSCRALTDVVIPSSVTAIGENAFSDCQSLSHLTIPDSVTRIEDYVFQGCTSLESVTIPDSVTSIGENAFEGCLIRSIVLPEAVTTIGSCAFYGCHALERVTICNAAVSIDDHSFSDCPALVSVELPETMAGLNKYMFEGTLWLENQKGQDLIIVNHVLLGTGDAFDEDILTIPDGVTVIGKGAFRGNGLLFSVTIPDSVTRIDKEAFTFCDALQELIIPSTVTEIAPDAFGHSPWARERASADWGVLIVNHILIDVDNDFKEFIIPDSVEWIRAGNSDLVRVFIPASVMYVDAGVFFMGNLKEVYYAGSESDWEKIEIGEDNDDLLGAVIHYQATEYEFSHEDPDEESGGMEEDVLYQQVRTRLVELKELLNEELIPQAVYDSSVQKLMDRFVSQ